MTDPIELRLFGEPRMLRAGRPVVLRTRKALALLAVLALQAGMRREGLATLLWPAVDAASARRNLRRELYQLRQAGLPLADGAGAPLALGEGWRVDAQDFRGALDAGDEAAALACSAATALVALDGVAGEAFDAWLHEQRRTLLGARQRARERLARRLADRDSAAALELWLQALDEDACQESVLVEAMSALAQRGDSARALTLYERSVAALRQVLDVAPSATTQALAAQLRGGPVPQALAPVSMAPGEASSWAAPSAARPAVIHEVRREQAATRVHQAWQRRQRVYLSGVPGIGKTHLACRCAADRGGWVRVPCRPNDTEQPYSSAIRALQVLREAAPDLGLPAWVARELSPLVPELGPGREPLNDAAARQRLCAAFAAGITLLARDNFAALVIDDWQWCDADSQALLAPLGLDDESLACVVAFRTAQLPPALLRALRNEVDGGTATLLELDGFDEADTLELLAGSEAHGDTHPAMQALAAQLQSSTGGNPFFLVETLRHLRERGWLQVDGRGRWQVTAESGGDDEPPPLPGSVRDAVLGRVRALGETTRRNLEAAALLGGRFDPELLAGLVGTTAEDLVPLLEHAEAARLLRADGTSYRFAHDLVGQCLHDNLSPARRQMLHARWAARLMQREAAPALVAAQFERALQPALAVSWRLQAGAAARRVHALADAQRQFETAVSDGAQGNDAVRAHLALASLHQLRADLDAATQAIASAMRCADQADPAARLEVRLAHVANRTLLQQPDAALAVLDGIAGELAAAPPATRARALVARGDALRMLGRFEQARAVDDENVALLESAPDALGQLGTVLDGVARRLLLRGEPGPAVHYARRAVAALEAVDDAGGLARTLVILGVALLHAAGDRAEPMAAFERARSLAAHCGNVEEQRAAILNLVKLHTDRGDSDAAIALLDESDTLTPHYGSPSLRQGVAAARFYVHYMRGEVDRAAEAATAFMTLLRAMAARQMLIIGVHQVLDLYLHGGRLDDARALLDEATEAAAQRGTPRPLELRLKTAWWHLAGGDVEAARAELESLEHEPAEAHPAHSAFEASLLHARIGAQVALALGDDAAARRHLERVDQGQEMPTDHEAMLLALRLTLAARTGTATGPWLERAQTLLRSGRVPHFEAATLRQALPETSRPA